MINPFGLKKSPVKSSITFNATPAQWSRVTAYSSAGSCSGAFCVGSLRSMSRSNNCWPKATLSAYAAPMVACCIAHRRADW